jgi:hypothetical protein
MEPFDWTPSDRSGDNLASVPTDELCIAILMAFERALSSCVTLLRFLHLTRV